MSKLREPLGFWKTVSILLTAARIRAAGRRHRQKALLNHRTPATSADLNEVLHLFIIVSFAVLNIIAAFCLKQAVSSAPLIQVESQGKIVVSGAFLGIIKREEKTHAGTSLEKAIYDGYYQSEARAIAERRGVLTKEIDAMLRDELRHRGSRNFISKDNVSSGMAALKTEPIANMIGSLMLLGWIMMLLFQGEGFEINIPRRKDPMWEWLFSHPAPPGAIFLAEMLSPIAANPIYWSAPLFVGSLFAMVYGQDYFIPAALIPGIPVTLALAFMGKAAEISVMLRSSPRTAGAKTALLSWIGYSSGIIILIIFILGNKLITAVLPFLNLFSFLPWPYLNFFLGGSKDGSLSFSIGLLRCLIAAGAAIAGSIRLAVWASQKGLGGNYSPDDRAPSRATVERLGFGKDPLYTKEFLWFIRDRGAIIQAILIPLTLAAFQAIRYWSLLEQAGDSWNYLCGVAIVFGTYFLWVLGPRSLASEGSALWISLTWPRGLESLLKAKAKLWSLISSAIVGVVMLYSVCLFPESIWKIALVGVGWYLFSRSMAEKYVTLVPAMSLSGEEAQIPLGRRLATSLGMFTFCIGILTQRWHLAIVGIVFSYLTAAAMWQNFRSRLPYLYDPWSEKLPPPPTLMHAMIAITVMVEISAVVTGMSIAFVGAGSVAVVQAFAYTLSAGAVSIAVSSFLADRGLRLHDIWLWHPGSQEESASRFSTLRLPSQTMLRNVLIGISGGLILGLFGIGYLVILKNFPATAEVIQRSRLWMEKIQNARYAYAFIAVGVAPFAEEYLFRGLLYRALDKEWGGWRAVIGSAAFFAIYHPPISWFPVGLMGIFNALLFKKTGNLTTVVIFHMIYNFVVLML